MTGRITIVLFTTLDGVAQAPGGPDEDTTGGFPYGGWQAPFFDEVVGGDVGEGIEGIDALVLGRRTYDIFAAYWPTYGEGEDNPIAQKFNSIPKYVASHGVLALDWEGSTQLGPDLGGELAALRERHESIQVIGSVDLAQTLLRERLYDELKLWVYPVVLGEGKKVFPDGAAPRNLRLVAPPVAGSTGAVLLRYAPAEGLPATGDMSQPERGV
ncbi:dihydrofolate reductase family protein [Microbacterium sp. B2969]|uniref:Dihydrofolate reductase family protein n=1 Tax=Microbacterium alkaliflavum TaxID=3248839 RepID=A0ABW7Q9S1_9MICO